MTIETVVASSSIVESVRIAIVGSRDFGDEEAVRAFVRTLQAGSVVISGGAVGVDSWAADEARKMGLEVVEHLPDWKRFGRKAGPLRNTTIIEDADEVAAFWDGVSRGTADSIRKGREAGKPVNVFLEKS